MARKSRRASIRKRYASTNFSVFSPSNDASFHTSWVKAHEFIRWLVSRGGGPLQVSKAMRTPSFQPTLHKICRGLVVSPKRASAERIAAHFKIPVDAVYDDTVASRLYERMCAGAQGPGSDGQMLRAREARPPDYVVNEFSTSQVLQELSRLLAQVPTTHKRSAVAALLASFAHEAGAPEYVDILTVALHPSARPRHSSAAVHDHSDVAMRPHPVVGAVNQPLATAPRPATHAFRPEHHKEAPSRIAS